MSAIPFKQQSLVYYIAYRFRDMTLAYPSPDELTAEITINGQPRTYLIRWTKGAYRPVQGIPNKQAERQAIYRLNQWRNLWRSSPSVRVTVRHRNQYMGNDVFAGSYVTIITWNGLTWNSDESNAYLKAGRNDENSTEWQIMDVVVPADAVLRYDSLQEEKPC